MNQEFIEALNQIEKEKGIEKEYILEAIEAALVNAYKRNYDNNQNVKIVMDRENGDISVFSQKTVVEEVMDKATEISIEEAKQIKAGYELGDIVDVQVMPKNFGRISAQTAKQMVLQKIREAEREILFNQYITKEKDIVTGLVQRREKKNIMIALGKLEAILAPNEQIPGETYTFNERVKVYVLEISKTSKGPQVYVSRTHPELVKRLFEQEVPEVHDGLVEIRSISREAGSRTKMAVYSKDPNVDAVGACVGQGGARVNVVVNELRGEKIDIINWSEDPKKFIAAALSPSKVLSVVVNEQEQSAKVVVPDHQLSLAIGKEGQNARLAAKLTGWKIDIKSETQARETNFVDESEIMTLEELEAMENSVSEEDFEE